VREGFVRQAVAEAAGDAPCFRLRRALWSYQDLYVVCHGEAGSPPPASDRPVGFLEGGIRSPDGRWVVLQGWAHDPVGTGIAHVEVRLDGELVACLPAELPRPEVAPLFGASGPFPCGFACSVAMPGGCSFGGDVLLSATAVSRGGARYVMHLGSTEGTELYVRFNDAEQRAATHAAELHRMRASRFWNLFWKLRDAWWSLLLKLRLVR
jgi:hypothetical protein